MRPELIGSPKEKRNRQQSRLDDFRERGTMHCLIDKISNCDQRKWKRGQNIMRSGRK